jgi:hypothetical protein
MVQEPTKPKVADPSAKLELCPNDEDDNSEFLKDGKTLPIAYPKLGYNCRLLETESLAQYDNVVIPQKGPGSLTWRDSTLEHCPDFTSKFTLVNNVTPAVAYPAAGYNCQTAIALV